MTAVWIALGAVGISLVTVFITLNAAQAKKHKHAAGDGDSNYFDSGTSNSEATDCGSDGGGGDCGGGGD